MVPPWADDVSPESDNPLADGDAPAEQQPPVPVAPPARFRAARRNLGSFARTGNSHDLRRALGSYVVRGYGGSGTFARRLSGTASTAGRLGGVLESGQRPDGTSLRDLALATAADVNVVMDAIVEAVRPIDGTQDAEASRRAVRDALSDLLDRFPDADLLALDAQQRTFVIERFTALDVYGRFCLDMHKTLMDKAPDASTGMARLHEVQSFIQQTVAAGFRKVHDRGGPTTTSIVRLTKQALSETFSVFEEYWT